MKDSKRRAGQAEGRNPPNPGELREVAGYASLTRPELERSQPTEDQERDFG